MEKSSFFNSISGDRKYKAEEWASYFASFIGNGFFPVPSTGLQVVTDSEMAVVLRPGKAWINGYFYINTADLTLPLAVADGMLSRIDRIVIRWDLTERTISVKVKSSNPASAPTAPVLQRDADAYELCVADVLVGKGVTSISQAMITDQRLNPALCGVVVAVVNQIDTVAFNAQLQAWFRDYMDYSTAEFHTLVEHMSDLKQAGSDAFSVLQEHLASCKDGSDDEFAKLKEWFETYRLQAQEDFNNWFNGLHDILDENAATHLLNLITGVSEAVTAVDQNVAERMNQLTENLQSAIDTLEDALNARMNTLESDKQSALVTGEHMLEKDSWLPYDVGTDDKWQQTLEIPGWLAANDFVYGFAPGSKYVAQAANISPLDTTEDGKVTFVCADKPEGDVVVRLTPVEVNG